MNLITRKDAIKQQITHFYTGIPCNRGHIGPRLASNRMCCQCAKEDTATRWKHDKTYSSTLVAVGPYCPTRITSRSEAIDMGLAFYFTGSLCKEGHLSERKVTNHTCQQCQREAYSSHKEKYKGIQKLRQSSHKQQIVTYHQRRWQQRKHLVEEKVMRKLQRRKDRATRSSNGAKRRAIKLQATPGWFDCMGVLKLYEDSVWLMQQSGIVHHVHHIIPLQQCKEVCGLHTVENLIVLTDEEHKWFHSTKTRLKSLW